MATSYERGGMVVPGALASAGFGGRIVERGTGGFDAARRTWNGLVDRHPLLIAQPRDAADIVTLVRVVAEQGVPLAVRGGGHSIPGLSTCDDRVVLDLSGIRDVKIDASSRSTTKGVADPLSELQQALDLIESIDPDAVDERATSV